MRSAVRVFRSKSFCAPNKSLEMRITIQEMIEICSVPMNKAMQSTILLQTLLLETACRRRKAIKVHFLQAEIYANI